MPVTQSSSSYPGFAARAKSVFTTWLENPTQVASVVPSSSALTDEIAGRSYVRDASCVVDLGPGTGETTEALLKHMRSDAKLLAIEKTKEFVEPLMKINDQRLVVSQGDAIDLSQYVFATRSNRCGCNCLGNTVLIRFAQRRDCDRRRHSSSFSARWLLHCVSIPEQYRDLRSTEVWEGASKAGLA
jgi:hypothetical protein